MSKFAESEVIARYVFLALIAAKPGLTDADLLNTCCASMYMDYFTYSQIKQEMKEKKLAQLSLRKNESLLAADGEPLLRWDLTETGKELLHTLNPTMPDPVLKFLANFSNSRQFFEEATAKVLPSGYGDYWAVLQLLDNNRLTFEYRIIVPTSEAAEDLGKRWRQNTAELYRYLLDPFNRKNDDPKQP